MVKKMTFSSEYSAPSVDVLEIASEQAIFAGSGDPSWEDSLDHYLNWGNNNQFE